MLNYSIAFTSFAVFSCKTNFANTRVFLDGVSHEAFPIVQARAAEA